MRCPKCHWFSEKIKFMSKVKKNDIINFLKRTLQANIKIKKVFFTGGEPTLWPDLASTINEIPSRIKEIVIFSNGSFPDKLKNINRKIYLRISIHNGLNWDKIKKCIKISEEKKWKLRFVSYRGALEQIKYPKWFKYEVTIKYEQIEESKKRLKHLIGKKIMCRPIKVYFGTDGQAYYCEKGLREKSSIYAENFTLWKNLPNLRYKKCVVDESCIANIINEQKYKLIKK